MGRKVIASRSARWDAYYMRLCIYRELNGHCEVTQKDDGIEKDGLQKWINYQRSLYRNGKLPMSCIDRLEWIDFQWTTRGEERSHQEWSKMFDQLLRYRDQNGHCRVPTRHEENPHLAAWVKNQRAYKLKLPKVRRDYLDMIGFCWDSKKDNWEEHYEQLLRYKSEHNTTDVTWNKQNKKEHQLCCWIRTQRKSYKEGKLEQSRVDRLSGIAGFCWRLDACKTGLCLCWI